MQSVTAYVGHEDRVEHPHEWDVSDVSKRVRLSGVPLIKEGALSSNAGSMRGSHDGRPLASSPPWLISGNWKRFHMANSSWGGNSLLGASLCNLPGAGLARLGTPLPPPRLVGFVFSRSFWLGHIEQAYSFSPVWAR